MAYLYWWGRGAQQETKMSSDVGGAAQQLISLQNGGREPVRQFTYENSGRGFARQLTVPNVGEGIHYK